MFTSNIIRCFLVAFALLRITTRGTALTIAELTAGHSQDIIRQTKSEEIRNYMNESADPCEDFYEFTCGNYAKYNPTDPKNQRLLNILQILDREMALRLKNTLKATDERDTVAERKVKGFYKSCLKAPQMMNVYGDKLRTVFKEFGSMPVLEGDQWQENTFDWTRTVAQMTHKSGIKIIFDIDIVTDLADNSFNRVAIGDPTLLLKERSLYVDEALSDYLEQLIPNIAANLVAFLGVDLTLALKTAAEIKDFEVALAQGITDEKLGLQLEEIYTLADTEQIQREHHDYWDFKRVIKEALDVEPNKIYVHKQYVETALRAVKNTPKRVVANYLFYSYMVNFITSFLESPTEMEDTCLDATKKHFYKALDKMIYRQYFTEQMEADVFHMWRELKLTFRNILQSYRLDWIREDTRSEALQKLKAMKLVISSYEDKNFTQEYEDLDINEEDYVHNIKSILMLRGTQVRAKMYLPPEPLDIGAESSFTPIYSPLENIVKLPVGFLQPYYLWSTSYPHAYNFASMGSIVGHELVHGFDDNGRNYDAKGNVLDWWDPESVNNFRERTKCFVNQYKHYIYGGSPLPESPLQAENIADNGGLRLAFQAYLNWYGKAVRSNDNLDLETFPGLPFNHKQLFFISFGNTWCSAVDADYMAIQTATDTHVPEKFRVIGSLSNFDEFSKAFNCPKGRGMNTLNKCEIY